MTEVRRYTGRTYGRNQESTSAASSAASRAFDEAVKPKPTNLKWGNASYSKPRNGDGPEVKKPKLEPEEPSDPFSFEFDSDRSPRKRTSRYMCPPSSRPVVMQPAVRITSSSSKPQAKPKKSELDDGHGDDFVDLTVKKSSSEVRTYSKRAGRKIKEEQDLSSYGSVKSEPDENEMEIEIKPPQDFHSTDSSQGTSESVIEVTDSQEISEDLEDEDGLYIEKDDGNTTDVKDDSFLLPEDEKEELFTRTPKREPRQQMMTQDGEEITVRFRSHYLNPEVYSKFTENVRPKDPVGRLSNSKVVHKDVLKHDSGTTLIVVCSPKVADQEIKQSNTQSKYFKDNLKDIAKSKKKTGEQIATRSRTAKAQPPEKDPYEMEDDVIEVPAKPEAESSESPIVISSGTEDSQPQEGQSLRRSSRINPEPEPKKVTVDAIVKNAKAAPPRKYHKIFRSRNVGFMEPQPEAPAESSEEPETQATEESATSESQSESQLEEVKAENVQMEQDDGTQESVMPEISSQSTAESQSQGMKAHNMKKMYRAPLYEKKI